LFQAALEFRDQAEVARQAIASEGLQKSAGAVRLELDARSQFARIWRDLGLHGETEDDLLGRLMR
jgi:hypothetical protein